MYAGRHVDRQTVRKADIQTGRQVDRVRLGGRLVDKQVDKRQAGRRIGRDRQVEGQVGRNRQRQAGR